MQQHIAFRFLHNTSSTHWSMTFSLLFYQNLSLDCSVHQTMPIFSKLIHIYISVLFPWSSDYSKQDITYCKIRYPFDDNQRKTFCLRTVSTSSSSWPAAWFVSQCCCKPYPMFPGSFLQSLNLGSISQFGLAPHFSQVRVGIYSTFTTCSSPRRALTTKCINYNEMSMFYCRFYLESCKDSQLERINLQYI